MKVRYANKKTSLIETDQAHKLRFPVAVVQSARRKIRIIRQAVDERDLRSLRSLNYEKLGGKRDGQRSIRLNNQWRLILHIDRDCEPLEIEILELNNHYE